MQTSQYLFYQESISEAKKNRDFRLIFFFEDRIATSTILSTLFSFSFSFSFNNNNNISNQQSIDIVTHTKNENGFLKPKRQWVVAQLYSLLYSLCHLLLWSSVSL